MKKISTTFFFTMILLLACKQEKAIEKSSQKDQDVNITIVKTVPINTSNENSGINSIGVVMSESEARPSFKTGGVIDKTFVKEGNNVKKGQLLATLIMSEINAQVNQAQEGLLKAERDLARVKNLYQDSVATLEQYQNVTTAYEVAKKTMEIARFNSNYSEVRAPIDGRVVKQIMHSGEVIGPGMPVYAIMGTGTKDWKIITGLVDNEWAAVNIGDEVVVNFDAYPSQSFTAKVTQKSAVGGNASGTFDIEVKLNTWPKTLAAGLLAKVKIKVKNVSVNTIPVEALVQSNGAEGEIFTNENGIARKKKVIITKILGDKVAISKGLEGISNVITIGASYLEDGDKIKS